MKKKVLFIINPVSGGKNKRNFPKLADKHLDKENFEADFIFTERAGHAFEIASEAVKEQIPVVVAVGGDGTINEVASAAGNSSTKMGIIPFGSGNGLALSLNISLNPAKALERINKLQSLTIDTAVLNGHKFFNMAGVGFDANISHKFAAMTSRGFAGYIRTAISEIIRYQPGVYRIEIDGKLYERTAFMISVANSPQYGNNAVISPGASLNDGLLDVCIVRPFPLTLFPMVALRMFTKTSDNSKYLEIIKGKNIRIVSDNNMMIHLDGEPEEMGKEILISVKPSSLSVLY